MCIKIFAIFILWSVFGLFLPAHNKKECWLNSYLRRNIAHGVAVTRSFSNFCDSLCYRFAGKFCRWSTGKSQNWFGKVTDKSSTAFPLNMHFLKSEDLAQYFHCITLLIAFWHKFHITIFFDLLEHIPWKMLIKSHVLSLSIEETLPKVHGIYIPYHSSSLTFLHLPFFYPLLFSILSSTHILSPVTIPQCI